MTHASRTKLILLGALFGAIALTLGLMARSGVAPATAQGGCANADAQPSEASAAEFKVAIICLIQRERASRGKSTLDIDSKLNRAARNHNTTMLDQDCFSHQCPGEPSVERRLRNAGYIRGDTWGFGENIGYESTPNEMMERFLGDPYHKRNVLAGKWVDIGAAATRGTPHPNKPDSSFVTYTVEFGYVG